MIMAKRVCGYSIRAVSLLEERKLAHRVAWADPNTIPDFENTYAQMTGGKRLLTWPRVFYADPKNEAPILIGGCDDLVRFLANQ
jgi:glutaredoxin